MRRRVRHPARPLGAGVPAHAFRSPESGAACPDRARIRTPCAVFLPHQRGKPFTPPPALSSKVGDASFSGGELGMAEGSGTAERAQHRRGRRERLPRQTTAPAGRRRWVLLAGLGVAYVISGDFAGWNFGLAEGGWGGLLIATILIATMYTCIVFSARRAVVGDLHGGRRVRLRAARARRLGRVPDRHGDPDRVRDGAGRDRRVHRRLRRVARRLRHHLGLAGLPGLLRDLRRRAPARRRRGAQGHVRDHRDRGRRAARLRRLDDPRVQHLAT